MRTKSLVIVGGTAAGLIAATYGFWIKQRGIKGVFGKYKKEALRDMYYSSLTQDDVAWG